MSEPHRNPFVRFMQSVYYVLDTPVTFFREKIVEPNQKHYPYYHQKFRRVPTIDECYTDDFVCKHEADEQFKRDWLVDSEILNILRERMQECNLWDENDRDEEKCLKMQETYDEAAANWFCKYGDLGPQPDSVLAFMKQKHRMVWERRHGPVGSGMKREEKIDIHKLIVNPEEEY